MGSNNGNHGPRTCVWRAWCHWCKRHLAYTGRQTEWPDEVRCPLCNTWRKCIAKGKMVLAGDVVCPHGSGRSRVEEK